MTSSSQPGGTGGPPLTPPYSALLLAGFTWHPMSPSNPVSSYLTLSPLPVETGGLLSVALSLGSPPLVITQHLALRSPDFPPSDLSQTAIIWPTPTNLLKRASPLLSRFVLATEWCRHRISSFFEYYSAAAGSCFKIRIRWQWGQKYISSPLNRVLYNCGGSCMLQPMQEPSRASATACPRR